MSLPNAGFQPPEALEGLPVPLIELDRAALRDGGVWRRSLPDADEAAERALARLPLAPTVRADGSPLRDNASPLSEQAPAPRPGRTSEPPRRRGRGKELTAVAAMIAVVGLLAALLVKIAPGHSGQRPDIGTPAATATATANSTASATATATANVSVPGHWTSLPSYTDSTTRSVALAPSDPSTAYAILTGAAGASATAPSKFGAGPSYTMRRTQDAGATWQTLPLPIPQPQDATSDAYILTGLLVSPADPRTVFLTTQLGTSALCQQYGASGIGKSASLCLAQFVSRNGGLDWQRLHVPTVAPQQRGVSELAGPLTAQGGRLYASIRDFCQCSGAASDARIGVSGDGGLTWTTADDALVAQGYGVDEFTTSPAGEVVFAVAEPVDASLVPVSQEGPPYTPGHLQLWRSTDAGASWLKLGDVPHNAVSGMAATTGPVGEHLVLYLVTDGDATGDAYAKLPVPVLEASTDGGVSWHAAPAVDLPGGAQMQMPLLVAHPDGSAMVLVTLTQANASALVSWRPGATTWKQLTNPFTVGSVSSVLFTSPSDTSPTPPDIYVVSDGGVQRFSVP